MIQSTTIDLKALHDRVLALEESVLELRIPFYKKYQLCIRIVSLSLIITFITIGLLFGLSTK